MKKIIFLLISFYTFSFVGHSQTKSNDDSVLAKINTEKFDSVKVNLLYQLGWDKFDLGKYDLAMKYTNEALTLAEKINFKKGIANCYLEIGGIYNVISDYPKALANYQNALKIYTDSKNNQGLASTLMGLGNVFGYLLDYKSSTEYYEKSLKIYTQLNDTSGIAGCLNNIGGNYNLLADYKTALQYFKKSLAICNSKKDDEGISTALGNIGNALFYLNDYSGSLENYTNLLAISENNGFSYFTAVNNNNIAGVYIKLGNFIEALKYVNKGLSVATSIGAKEWQKESYGHLIVIDSSTNNFKDAFAHQKLYMQLKDSMFNEEKDKKLTEFQMTFDFDKKSQADSILHASKIQIGEFNLQKQKTFTYAGVFALCIVLVLLFFVSRNYRLQREANNKLREAQQQLIKSEKMAAFGVMASRVAHEIQNPLNFVNNFSDLNEELVNDILESKTDDERKLALTSLVDNSKMIKQHGQRVALIVNELQQHSRAGTAHEFFDSK